MANSINNFFCHKSTKRFFELFILSLLIFWGLFVRLDDIHDWYVNPEATFYSQEPLIATGDGYYYLSLAKDLSEKKYNRINEKRAIPNNIARPFPPPLLSVLTYVVYKLTPFSLNWIAVVLPAFLGVLLSIPLYGLGRFLGGGTMGLSAVAVGLVSNSYVARTCLGQYDTDCLNVTFTMAIIYCLIKFATGRGYERYKFIVYGVVLYGLFLWWWDQSPLMVSLITLGTLFIAIVFFYRPLKVEGIIFFSISGLICFFLFLWQGFDLPIRFIAWLSEQIDYIFKISDNGFPSAGLFISEQKNMSLALYVERATSNVFVFVLAVAGILWLIWRRPQESIFLSIPVILAVLPFFADRFMIFISPVMALGVGFTMAQFRRFLEAYRPLLIIIPCLLFFIVWECYKGGSSFASPFPVKTIAGMELIQQQTPENAVVWTWCDNGYPISYWAERATVCDGQTHDGELLVYNAIPFATSDSRLAANFMRFYIARGTGGIKHFYSVMGNDKAVGLETIKKILAAGPENASYILDQLQLPATEYQSKKEDWLTFFFPNDTPPVFLFLDWGQMLNSYIIEWLGTWNIAQQDGLRPLLGKLFSRITVDGLSVKNHTGTMHADLQDGLVTYKQNIIPLSGAVFRTSKKIKKYEFGYRPVIIDDKEGTYLLEIFEPQNFALLVNRETYDFVLNKLFWLRELPPSEYFRQIVINTPDFQLWEVGGDIYKK